jgi:hypothetical protein
MANHRRIFILAGIAFLSLSFAVIYLTSTQKTHTKQNIQQHRYFSGTQHEVTAYVISGKEAGPTLLVIGGIHGDESAGYLTADRYTSVSLRRGTLIVVPRLNLPAILKKKRYGISGDMNRLFHLSENSNSTPDLKVVALAKSLIKRSDYILNLHQADGFYSPIWVSRRRNPQKWGQCNVIDAPIFDLPNGEKLELANLARKIAARSNTRIANKQFHFQVNNTNTASNKSLHTEQRRSLTYYALYKAHKMALALESTKNCTLPQAVAFLTIAINSVIGEMGIQAENLPSEDILFIDREITGIKT